MWFLLLGCSGGGGGGTADIDTSALFRTDIEFQAFRHLEAGEYGDPVVADVLDEEDLLLARFDTDGCDAAAWRVALRTGGAWEAATPIGAIHLDDAGGLAICAWEDADGTVNPFSPPITLWTDADGIGDGETIVSGDWSTTASRREEVATYFGRFPLAASFALAGSGALDQWTLTMAPDFGLILLESPDFTADLVYTR